MSAHTALKLVQQALEIRFSEESVFNEVVCGPAGSSRMDFVAVTKSWAKPCITGIEIKVSVSDLRNDSKWGDYLQYCNRFAFACPKGLIKPKELPDGVGLIYCSAAGARYVKKSVFRPLECHDIYARLIMNHIDPPQLSPGEQYRLWVDGEISTEQLGWRVGAKLSKAFVELVAREKELEQLKCEVEPLAKIQDEMNKILKPLGYNYHIGGNAFSAWQDNLKALVQMKLCQERAARLQRAIPEAERLVTLLRDLTETIKHPDADTINN